MTPEQSAQIWNGLEARLAGVETFLGEAPPWAPPAEDRDAVLRPIARTSGVRVGPAVGRRERLARPSSAVIGLAAAIVLAVVVGTALVRPSLVGPGATQSPSVSPISPSPISPSPASPASSESTAGDFGTPPPTYTAFVNPAYAWSASYNADWSVFDEPFPDGPHGVTQFVPWNAGQRHCWSRD